MAQFRRARRVSLLLGRLRAFSITTYGELWQGAKESAENLAIIFESDANSLVGAEVTETEEGEITILQKLHVLTQIFFLNFPILSNWNRSRTLVLPRSIFPSRRQSFHARRFYSNRKYVIAAARPGQTQRSAAGPTLSERTPAGRRVTHHRLPHASGLPSRRTCSSADSRVTFLHVNIKVYRLDMFQTSASAIERARRLPAQRG